MKIADSILVDAPVERVSDVVKERHVLHGLPTVVRQSGWTRG